MREIEIKLRVNNLGELEKKLKDSGLVISKEITQHDVIYTDIDDLDVFFNMKVGNVVIRIRDEKGASTLTLKKQRGQFIARATHREGTDSLTPEQRAIQKVKSQMRDKGIDEETEETFQ